MISSFFFYKFLFKSKRNNKAKGHNNKVLYNQCKMKIFDKLEQKMEGVSILCNNLTYMLGSMKIFEG